MREFIYYSGRARTSGNFDDLMQAGRMDIAIHSLINAFFLSNSMREDVRFHFIFYGQPDPPKHLEFRYNPEMPISKKDVAGLIKRMLYKYRPGEKREVFPGCFVEKKGIFEVIDEMKKEGKEVYVLDKKGENVSKVKLSDNPVFIIGDQEGFPPKELKRLEKESETISVGKKVYFASHIFTILNYIIDATQEA
jgi:tRNA pseudouridine-54 N-methylase